MLVNLRRGWFAPNGTVYQPAGNPHEMPDSWKDRLPSTASIAEPVAADEEVPAKAAKK